jgi:nucleoid-associated protein YgaU
MPRSIRLLIAASFVLAGCNMAPGQDAQNNNPAAPAAGPAVSSAPAGDDLATLQAENAALKKEVADAKHTIARLQAELAKAGIHHQTATETPPAANPADASAVTDNNEPGGTYTHGEVVTNAAPAGPLNALPLDSANAVANAAAPGTPAADAGPSKSYTVLKGDSLWKIAHKMYPHDTLNGEDKIRDANKDVFNGKYLKPGQVLVIPQ